MPRLYYTIGFSLNRININLQKVMYHQIVKQFSHRNVPSILHPLEISRDFSQFPEENISVVLMPDQNLYKQHVYNMCLLQRMTGFKCTLFRVKVPPPITVQIGGIQALVPAQPMKNIKKLKIKLGQGKVFLPLKGNYQGGDI